MIETRAPGKLYITGEYAVVEPGGAAVLAAVDRYITVRLSEGSSVGRVRSSAYGQTPLEWVRDTASDQIVLEHQPYDYVFAAITAVEEPSRRPTTRVLSVIAKALIICAPIARKIAPAQ